jgi:prepilin-type N-terminal cleavage/methylation domain-containing protein
MVKLFSKFLARRNQQGFTLIELLVALAITSVISVGLSTTIMQMATVGSSSQNRTEAIKQVENALHYINRDAEMAFPSQTTINTSDNYFSSDLILKWIDNSGTNYQVIYYLNTVSGIKCLQRSETIGTAQPSILRVASKIDQTRSFYTFDGKILTVELTAQVNGMRPATETRTLKVAFRPTYRTIP